MKTKVFERGRADNSRYDRHNQQRNGERQLADQHAPPLCHVTEKLVLDLMCQIILGAPIECHGARDSSCLHCVPQLDSSMRFFSRTHKTGTHAKFTYQYNWEQFCHWGERTGGFTWNGLALR